MTDVGCPINRKENALNIPNCGPHSKNLYDVGVLFLESKGEEAPPHIYRELGLCWGPLHPLGGCFFLCFFCFLSILGPETRVSPNSLFLNGIKKGASDKDKAAKARNMPQMPLFNGPKGVSWGRSPVSSCLTMRLI